MRQTTTAIARSLTLGPDWTSTSSSPSPALFGRLCDRNMLLYGVPSEAVAQDRQLRGGGGGSDAAHDAGWGARTVGA